MAGCVVEVVAELGKELLQLSRSDKRLKPLVEGMDHGRLDEPSVRDVLMELGCEIEARKPFRPPRPGLRILRLRGAVEGAVDLDQVHVAGNEGELVLHPLGVDAALPVGVGPARDPAVDPAGSLWTFGGRLRIVSSLRSIPGSF